MVFKFKTWVSQLNMQYLYQKTKEGSNALGTLYVFLLPWLHGKGHFSLNCRNLILTQVSIQVMLSDHINDISLI